MLSTLGAVILHRQGKSHRRRWPSLQRVAGRAALARETAAAAPQRGGLETLDCSSSALCVHPVGQDRLRQRGKHRQRSGTTHASDRVGGRLSSWATTLRCDSGPAQDQPALQARSPRLRSFRTTWYVPLARRSPSLPLLRGCSAARTRVTRCEPCAGADRASVPLARRTWRAPST